MKSCSQGQPRIHNRPEDTGLRDRARILDKHSSQGAEHHSQNDMREHLTIFLVIAARKSDIKFERWHSLQLLVLLAHLLLVSRL